MILKVYKHYFIIAIEIMFIDELYIIYNHLQHYIYEY